jgi:phosphatidylserine/phosphatidylglycerophosphate/cardiolipin synthase-like enzyme
MLISRELHLLQSTICIRPLEYLRGLVRLLIQPGDGVQPLVKAIRKAKKSVEIVIFRFDQPEIEKALIEAVGRGVFVHALIAFTNKGGEANLRKLEMRFLEKGITVARTAGDLVRYHGKMLIIDRKELYVLAFNFTHLDIERSRSFGLVTRNAKLVAEAAKLFECDTKRQPYTAGNARFVVSPANARKELLKFISGAKKELLVYDLKISDRQVLRALQERTVAGVRVRVVGCISSSQFSARDLTRMRLHTRAIIRDRDEAFIGSQSLRRLELDDRREIGLIFGDAAAVKALHRVFELDWKASRPQKGTQPVHLLPKKAAKKIAKAVKSKIPVANVIEKVAKEVRRRTNGKLDQQKVKATVEEAVKVAVDSNIKDAAAHALKRALTEVAREAAHAE